MSPRSFLKYPQCKSEILQVGEHSAAIVYQPCCIVKRFECRIEAARKPVFSGQIQPQPDRQVGRFVVTDEIRDTLKRSGRPPHITVQRLGCGEKAENSVLQLYAAILRQVWY